MHVIKMLQSTRFLRRCAASLRPCVHAATFSAAAEGAPGAGAQHQPLKEAHNAHNYSTLVSDRSFETHAELIRDLQARGVITKPEVAQAMMQLDRAPFAQTYTGMQATIAFVDSQVSIGSGQHVSAPSLHALCLELLSEQLVPGAHALDVGCGSGYLVACMGLMVGRQGYALGIDKHRKLVDLANWNMLTNCPALLDPAMIGNTEVIHGNVLQAGFMDGWEPFDAICVGASCREIPQVLLDKLKPGGRMVLPVGAPTSMQMLMVVDKDAQGNVTQREEVAVKFTPLTPPASDIKW